jgi:hypothetical protein
MNTLRLSVVIHSPARKRASLLYRTHISGAGLAKLFATGRLGREYAIVGILHEV